MSSFKQVFSGLLKPILRKVRLDRVDDVADRFRVIELSGESLAGSRCAAGDKLQVLIDGDFRTYTPFGFDPAAGRLSLLAFSHGEGPGAKWARAARSGDGAHVFGPRGSLPLADLPTPALLVGDETSLASGRALQELGRSGAVVLEVDDVTAARAAARAIGLHDVIMVSRAAQDAHIPELWNAVAATAPSKASLVLTGKAQTIQALRALVRRDQVNGLKQKNKAYWAPGKRGLD